MSVVTLSRLSAKHPARPSKPEKNTVKNNCPPLAIRGLVFEAANVLYDATLWRRELVRRLARLGLQASYPEFFIRWDQEYLPDVNRGFRQYEEAIQNFLLSAGLTWGQIDEVEAATRVHRQQIETHARPLPGVVATIAGLCERGIPLAILADSHHPANKLREQIEQLGLVNRFRGVFTSFDLETTKPAPVCFQAALDTFGLPAQQVALVASDRQSLDGAAACGMRTAAFNWQEDVTAEFSLSQFGELLTLVDQTTP